MAEDPLRYVDQFEQQEHELLEWYEQSRSNKSWQPSVDQMMVNWP